MALDQQKIGQVAAELMDQADREFPDGSEVGAVLLVVEVTNPDGDSRVIWQVSDPRLHANLGMIEVARHAMLKGAG